MADNGNREFKPIQNPYIVGNPIEDRRMFFGREDDFKYIRTQVSGARKGGLIVLCGTRRSGKTSILFQVNKGRLGEDFVPVLIDMQSITVGDDREFVERLAQEIVAAIDDPRLELESDFPLREDANPFALFRNLTAKIKDVLGSRKLILMFDEYELFETKIDKGNFSSDVLNMLLNWMDTISGVFIIFTGSDRIEKRNAKYWQVFMGRALHKRISFLSEEDTYRLIREPVKGRVFYEDGLPERIYEMTAGQPFYTQVLVQHIIDHLNEVGRNEAVDADLEHVLSELIDNPLPQMIFTWTSLNDLEKVALSVIGELGRENAPGFSAKDIQKYLKDARAGIRVSGNKLKEALERLLAHDLLTRDKKTELLSFKMGLWNRWVARMHSIWQVVDEITKGGSKAPDDGVKPDSGGGRGWLWTTAAVLAIAAPVIAWVWSQGGGSDPQPPPPPPRVAVISVTSTPPEANVYLGDRYLGMTPVENDTVLAGTRILAVTLPGFIVRHDTLDMQADTTIVRHFDLAEQVGSLELTSEPDGAAVYIDREPTGLRTPCRVDGLASRVSHRVGFVLSGYNNDIHEEVWVTADSIRSLRGLLARSTADITVVSRPDRAEVRINDDGTLLGLTPRPIADVPHGELTLEVSKPGYETVRRTVTIPSPDNMVTVELPRLPPGKLVFKVHPYADSVYIDGIQQWGSTVFIDSLELEVGEHEIEFRRGAAGVFRTVFEIESGVRHELEHEFD